MDHLEKRGTGIAVDADLDGDVVLAVDPGPSPPLVDLVGDLVTGGQADPPQMYVNPAEDPWGQYDLVEHVLWPAQHSQALEHPPLSECLRL